MISRTFIILFFALLSSVADAGEDSNGAWLVLSDAPADRYEWFGETIGANAHKLFNNPIIEYSRGGVSVYATWRFDWFVGEMRSGVNPGEACSFKVFVSLYSTQGCVFADRFVAEGEATPRQADLTGLVECGVKVGITLKDEEIPLGDTYTCKVTLVPKNMQCKENSKFEGTGTIQRPYPPMLDVKLKRSDPEAGSLTLGWDWTEKDKNKSNYVNANPSYEWKCRIWRSSDNDEEEYDCLQNAIVVTNDILMSNQEFTDFGYGKIPGFRRVRYWVEVMGGVEKDGHPDPFPYKMGELGWADARQRYCISLGLSSYDDIEEHWKGDIPKGHIHSGNESELFSDLVGESSLAYQLSRRDSLCKYVDVTNYFHAVAESVTPGDEVFFYISTHGNVGILALYDGVWEVNDLKKQVLLFKDKGVKFVGVINACHSGSIIKEFNTNEFRYTAWVAASDYNELAGCWNDLSYFGRVFLDWGWNNGYAKQKTVVSKEGLFSSEREGGGMIKETFASDSEYVNMAEVANYTGLLVTGKSSQVLPPNGTNEETFYEQHITSVNTGMLWRTDLKKIQGDITAEIPDKPYDMFFSEKFENDSSAFLSKHLVLKVRPSYLFSSLPPDRLFLLRYIGDSENWVVEKNDGVSLFTKQMWQICYPCRISGQQCYCSAPYLESGVEYDFDACILGPGGWSGYCKPIKKLYDNGEWIMRMYEEGCLEAVARVRRMGTRSMDEDELTIKVDTEETYIEGQAKLNVSFSAQSGRFGGYYIPSIWAEIGNDGILHAEVDDVSATYTSVGGDQTRISGNLVIDMDGADFSAQWGGMTFTGNVQAKGNPSPDDGMIWRIDNGEVEEESESVADKCHVAVNFCADGCEPAMTTRIVTVMQKIGTLPVPISPDGAEFLGWFTAIEGGVQISPETQIIEPRTFYAKWIRSDLGFQGDKEWTQPFFLTNDPEGSEPMTSFQLYDIIYVKYGFKNMAADSAVKGFVNCFQLNTGERFVDDWSDFSLAGGSMGYGRNHEDKSCWNLLNLKPGRYTLTCKLDADNAIDEVDESNNEMSITFTVSSSWGSGGDEDPFTYKCEVMFDANGGTCSETNRVVESGKAIGTLPTPVLNGYKFLGWFDDPEDEDAWKISATTKIYMDETYYAHWEYDGSAMVTVAVAEGCEAMGKVTGGNATFKVGAKVSLKATANKGYVFSRWEKTGNGEQGTGNGSELLSQAASFTYVATGEPVSIVAVFAKASDDAESLKVEVADDVSTEADGSLSLDLGECVESLSQPKLTVSGLPSGLKYDAKTGLISGKATKPGVYTVKVTATNASATGKNAVVKEFTITVPNLTSELFTAAGLKSDESYVLQAGIAPDLKDVVAAVAGGGWKLAVSGLPSGVKYDAKSGGFTGVATKEGFSTVYFTATRGSGRSAEKQVATATFEVVFPTLALSMAAWGDAGATNKCKVAGGGKYPFGKKVTIKATADKGSVFMGWEKKGNGEQGTGNGFVSQAASWSFTMPSNDVEYVAKFVTSGEDKASIELAVNGEEMAAARPESAPYRTNVWCGVYLEWPVAASALSAPTVKVSGLPAGLKFAAKPVTSKIGTGKNAITVTNVSANTIYGAPTAASKTKTDKAGNVTVTPSAVKVTVTTAGKSSQTYQIDTVVDPLPAWAVGTYSGGVLGQGTGNGEQGTVEVAGQVSLTVDAKGKISGKALGDGLTYTLAAPYYSGFAVLDDGGEGLSSNFLADVTAGWSYKEGSKTIKTNDVVQLTVQDNGIGGVAAGGPQASAAEAAGEAAAGDSRPPEWTAWQYNWKVDPWKDVGKKFDKKMQVYAIRADGTFIDGDDAATVALDAEVTGRVTLKFAASGAVSVSGEFVTYDEKKDKYTTVKATGSATLVPIDGDQGAVFIYLTPKGLTPHARSLDVEWPKE